MVSYPRLKAGLKKRLIVFEAIRRRDRKLIKHASSLNSYTLLSIINSKSLGRRKQLTPVYRVFFSYVNFSFAYQRYSDKEKVTRLIKDKTQIALIRSIALGEISVETIGFDFSDISVADYSTIYNIPINCDAHFLNVTRGCIVKFLSKYDRVNHQPLSGLKAWAKISGVSVPDSEKYRIGDLKSTLRAVLRASWSIANPVALNNLIRMCDPEDKLKQEARELTRINAYTAMLDGLFLILNIFRSINGYDERSKEEILIDIDNLYGRSDHIYDKLLKYFDCSYSDGLEVRYRGRDVSKTIIYATVDIYMHIAMQHSREIVCKCVLDLYNVDPDAVLFLNWGQISDYFRRYPAATSPVSIVTSILMTSPTIARRFPVKVGLSMGSGRANRQLFSRAADYVRRHKSPRVAGFLREFLTIRGSARDLLFRYLADKSVAERLYSVFSKKNETSGVVYEEKAVSETRIQILKFIRDTKTIEDAYYQKLINEESAILRAMLFRDIYSNGRLFLDEFELMFEVERLLLREFNFREVAAKDTAGAKQLYTHFATILSDRLTDVLLFQSDFSVEAVLSNNLRHGVIEPQILNALDMACRDASDIERMAALKADVAAVVQGYITDWLRVEEGGGTAQLMERRLIQMIEQVLESETRNPFELSVLIADRAVDEVRRIIEMIAVSAVNAVDSQLVPLIKNVCANYSGNGTLTAEMNDIVSQKLEGAIADIKPWIAIANILDTIDRFSIVDLIRFEMGAFVSHKAANTDSLIRIETRRGTRINKVTDVNFPADYFHVVFAIVHNLISNAAKYSGLREKTAMKFSVRAEAELLVFRLENAVDDKLSFDQLTRLREDALSAAVEKDEGNVFAEGGTGFRKIRRLCKRHFEKCDINIPELGKTRRSFIVEVRVAGDFAGLIE